jgi:protein required for attachment to host cells
MKRACIAIVDAARARVYTYEEDSTPGQELREVVDLVNPGRRLKAGEMFSESRPALANHGGLRRSVQGGNRTDSGEPGSTYDDHRGAHIEEMDNKFAKQVVEALDRVILDEKLGHLILIAPPKMLGTLRKNDGVLHREGLALDEITQDLTNLSPAMLHDRLASLDLIPPRQRLKMAR